MPPPGMETSGLRNHVTEGKCLDIRIPEHHLCLDNSGSDSRNLIGQLQVSKRGRNLERDSKCQWGGF